MQRATAPVWPQNSIKYVVYLDNSTIASAATTIKTTTSVTHVYSSRLSLAQPW